MFSFEGIYLKLLLKKTNKIHPFNLEIAYVEISIFMFSVKGRYLIQCVDRRTYHSGNA